jgi:hypothetical protein
MPPPSNAIAQSGLPGRIALDVLDRVIADDEHERAFLHEAGETGLREESIPLRRHEPARPGAARATGARTMRAAAPSYAGRADDARKRRR